MFSLFKKKSNLPAIQKGTVCLNCDTMLNGDENFCPNCGQKNKGEKLTFGSFLHELFAGLTSWDTKFWNTIIPLVTKPGKVSKDYIEGKRIRYTNPFRFYLTTSIIFFLLVGAVESYEKIKTLTTGEERTVEVNTDSFTEVERDSIARNAIQNVNKILDSVNVNLGTEIGASEIKIPKKYRNINYSGGSQVSKIFAFKKKYPDLKMDAVLDSLKMKKSFLNRFLYSKVDTFKSIEDNPEELKKVAKEMLSYISIALFLLLPILAVFLKLLYIRKSFTYVEHLVFVFHLQTVFFLLAILFFVISIITVSPPVVFIFLIAFLLYLYKAMRKFYQQNRFKTIFKFFTANFIYLILASFGTAFVAMAAFAFY